MTVSAPPRPPQPPAADELEALIEERADGARRRRLAYLVAALAAVGVALGVSLGGGGGARQAGAPRSPTPPASGARERQQIERAARRATIVEAGLMTPGLGWAANGLGLWLTEDGGKRWRAITPAHVAAIGDPVARIDQIQFVDGSHGWISASDTIGGVVPPSRKSLRHMEIDRTTDGGKSWQWSIPPGCLERCGGAYLSFLDVRHGYALTGLEPEPRLYATANGGKTWRLVFRPPFSGPFVFVDRRRGFGARAGALYRTLDGGRHWRAVRLTAPPRYAGQARTVGAPQFFGARDGVVPVRFLERAARAQRLVVYTTGDGGSTWSPHAVPVAVDLRAYSFGFAGARIPFSAPSPTTWIVVAGRTLHRTVDAGRTWTVVHLRWAPKPPAIWDVDFTSRSSGWAIFGTRNGAALVHTTNGGRDWRPLAPPVPKLAALHTRPACGSACRRP